MKYVFKTKHFPGGCLLCRLSFTFLHDLRCILITMTQLYLQREIHWIFPLGFSCFSNRDTIYTLRLRQVFSLEGGGHANDTVCGCVVWHLHPVTTEQIDSFQNRIILFPVCIYFIQMLKPLNNKPRGPIYTTFHPKRKSISFAFSWCVNMSTLKQLKSL